MLDTSSRSIQEGSGAKIGREGLGGDRGSSSRQSAAVWVGSFCAVQSVERHCPSFGLVVTQPVRQHIWDLPGLASFLSRGYSWISIECSRARAGRQCAYAHMLEGAASLMRSGKTARKPSRCHCTSNEAISRIASAFPARLWYLVHGKRLLSQSKDQHNTT